jgi:serine/threonine-protein kinase PpkA
MKKFPQIPGYDIKKYLGGGGMANVFLAVPERQQQLVAIKVMLRTQFDPQHVRRFTKEARTISSLKHPGIVRIFDIGKTDSLHFIVMEFFPETLKERIRQRGRMPPAEALTIISQIARTLYYIHGQGFIHRDVKPDNIMFRTDGLPVILDFGIARTMESLTKLTVTGIALGTPRYMSPEQIQAQKLDGRTDIYSLGVVLFEMLTGKPPYRGSDQTAVTIKHVTEIVPVLPDELQTYQPLIDAMMAKDRRHRPATESDWLALVKPLLTPFKLPRVEPLKIPKEPAAVRDKTRLSATRHRTTASRRPVAPRKKPKRGKNRFWLHLLLIATVIVLIIVNLENLPRYARHILALLGVGAGY